MLKVQQPSAADFNLVDGIEVVNPTQVIATLAEGAKLSMVVTVRRGMGYVPAEANKVYSKYEVGVIPIDAIYTPVNRVVYNVEKTRGDLDELTLAIETTGAIKAKDALARASKMLVDYLQSLLRFQPKRTTMSSFVKMLKNQQVRSQILRLNN